MHGLSRGRSQTEPELVAMFRFRAEPVIPAEQMVVGLGNPGRQYAGNRHNAGFLAVDRFAEIHGLKFSKKLARADIAIGKVSGKDLVLAKPQTFMNLSGESVRGLLRRLGLGPPALIVVYDDLDLPLGRIRIREKGSAGGHRGIKSIIEHIRTQEFLRVRVGIGRPGVEGDEENPDVKDYVLSDFTPEEMKIIKPVYDKVAEAIKAIIDEGAAVAMNRYNR